MANTFRVTTFNVRCLPPMDQTKVEADVQEAAKHSDVILWQEIGLDRYKAAIRGLGPEWDHFIPEGLGDAHPISWRKAMFEREGRGALLLHEAGPFCADRAITWVRLRQGRRRFVFNNAHYVARAWHPDGTAKARPNPREREDQHERQAVWLKGNARHKRLIQTWVNAGYTVFGGGDFNRAGHYEVVGRSFGKRKVQYLSTEGIDYLYVVPKRTHKITRDWLKRRVANSDHMIRTAAVTVRRAGIFNR